MSSFRWRVNRHEGEFRSKLTEGALWMSAILAALFDSERIHPHSFGTSHRSVPRDNGTIARGDERQLRSIGRPCGLFIQKPGAAKSQSCLIATVY